LVSNSFKKILDQTQITPFQAIPVRPKPISSIPSYSSQAKTDFFIPSHSSKAKTDFLHSKSFKSGQNRLPPFQAIPVGPKLTSVIQSPPKFVQFGQKGDFGGPGHGKLKYWKQRLFGPACVGFLHRLNRSYLGENRLI
jgi:hypothetical protein